MEFSSVSVSFLVWTIIHPYLIPSLSLHVSSGDFQGIPWHKMYYKLFQSLFTTSGSLTMLLTPTDQPTKWECIDHSPRVQTFEEQQIIFVSRFHKQISFQTIPFNINSSIQKFNRFLREDHKLYIRVYSIQKFKEIFQIIRIPTPKKVSSMYRHHFNTDVKWWDIKMTSSSMVTITMLAYMGAKLYPIAVPPKLI